MKIRVKNAMNRLARCAVASFVIVPAMAVAQNSQTIYKFVDEGGRVTYANSPIKGGAKLNLEPLTIIQSSPGTPSTNGHTANSAPVMRIPVAKVTSVPSPSFSNNALPVAFAATVAAPIKLAEITTPLGTTSPPIAIAALDTAGKSQERVNQHRADARRMVVVGEVQAEELSLEAARLALAEEQRRSGGIRTMRAAFAATALAVTPQKPLISPEVRAEIERHFERVRNLQDQVAMHESSIATLRQELVATK